jgi:hypothetical protein
LDDINILGTDATIIAGLLILMTLVSFEVERSKSGNSFQMKCQRRIRREVLKE